MVLQFYFDIEYACDEKEGEHYGLVEEKNEVWEGRREKKVWEMEWK